ncbi:uncharacterized protein [Atheta coriaria]|uniref:uncharacterized protein isoform X2 n=1 Tax=Dalotia coriaria TaxID=877792 RepID=UPI0031F412D4
MVDLATREIRPLMTKYKMDPFLAPNQSQSLYLVSLSMTNVTVCNMSTIKRAGDIIVLDDEPGRKLTIQVKLTFDDLQLISNYKSSAFLIASIGKVVAKIPGLLVDFIIEINFQTVEVQMTSFKLINSNSAMQVYLSGNLESYVINLVSGIVVRIVDDIMLMIVQGPLKNQINKVLDIVNDMLQTTLTSVG